MSMLKVENLIKRFSITSIDAVSDVSFELMKGEILVLVGPSGCGKTTTLRMIAGLEGQDSGRIWINEKIASSDSFFLPAHKREIGMVFQDHALFPHLNVLDNVAFGLIGLNLKEKKERAIEMLELVSMNRLAKRHPYALSGGERQRVALARALAPRPALVLMDEPFSSLDADMRLEMREQVRLILKSLQATVVFVTHDQEESLTIGDRLAIMQNGKLEQIGTPEDIFHAPASRFVAEFMGNSDFFEGITTKEGISTEIGHLRQDISIPPGTKVEIATRADDVGFELDDKGNAEVVGRFFKGAFNVYRLRLKSGRILHSLMNHTYILPVGVKVSPRIISDHPLPVFRVGSTTAKN